MEASILGENHPIILTIQQFLARVQGGLDAVQNLIADTPKQMEQVWGENHTMTMLAASSLALTLRDKGDLVQAETILLNVMH